MSEKKCLDCDQLLPRDQFSANKRKADGLDIYCRVCSSARNKAYYQANKEKRLAANKIWRDKHPEKMREYTRKWQIENPEKLAAAYAKHYRENRERLLEQDRQRRLANIELFLAREQAREERDKPIRQLKNKRWREQNPGKIRAQAAKRRSILRQRIPSWVTGEDIKTIEQIYEAAALMSEAYGVLHHVDHVIPLRGKYVSGLHVAENLHIIPATENLKKSNRWVPQ